jgi:7-carboxy-7-deazaguanine synthase
MSALKVYEIFASIQGESSWAGLACTFVRLAGCPLDCRWCDTVYAKSGGQDMELSAILDQAAALGHDLVEVTGGEPLSQAGTPALLSALCDSGYTVLLETNGCEDISGLDQRVHVIMDIKCPSSGMAERTRWQNLEVLKPTDEVKLVLADRADYEYARQVINEHDLAGRCGVLLSTVHGQLEPRLAVEWLLADKLPVRFQLQLHKYIWPPDTRGV